MSDREELTMQYQVFVQNPSEQHFVALVVNVPGVTAEGHTKEEAIAKAKAMLEEQLALGEFVTIEVGAKASEPASSTTLSPQERAEKFMRWAKSHSSLNAPLLSDEAVSRESIYSREDEMG